MRANGRHDIDRPIAVVLLAGMLTSIVLMLAGVVLVLIHPGDQAFHLLQPAQAIRAMVALRPDGWLSLGIFTLILTPVLRVLMAIVSFIWVRDWRYAAVSAAVLAAMAIGFLLGRG